MTGKRTILTGENLQVVSYARVTTNCRKSAEGIVVLRAGETRRERRPEQLTVGVKTRLWETQTAPAERGV